MQTDVDWRENNLDDLFRSACCRKFWPVRGSNTCDFESHSSVTSAAAETGLSRSESGDLEASVG